MRTNHRVNIPRVTDHKFVEEIYNTNKGKVIDMVRVEPVAYDKLIDTHVFVMVNDTSNGTGNYMYGYIPFEQAENIALAILAVVRDAGK